MRSAFIERQTASCVRLIPFTLLCNFCSCCWCSASCAKYTFLCFTRVQFSGERIDIWILQSQSLKRNIKFKKRYAAIFASCEMQQNHEIAYRLHTNEHNTTQWCGCVCVLCTLSTFCGLTANQIDQNFVLRSNLLAFTEFFFHSWMALVTWIAGIHQEKCSKCPKYGKEIACHHSYWCDKCRWTSRNPSHRRLWPISLEPCEQQEACIDGIMNWFERMMANFTWTMTTKPILSQILTQTESRRLKSKN